MKCFIFILLIVLAACETPVCCDPGPEIFAASIYTSEGIDYLGKHSGDGIDFYYMIDDKEVYLEPIIGVTRDTTYLNVLNLHTLIPANRGLDFYLKINNDIDTLNIFMDKKGKDFENVIFNGVIFPIILRKDSSPFFSLTKNK